MTGKLILPKILFSTNSSVLFYDARVFQMVLYHSFKLKSQQFSPTFLDSPFYWLSI